MSTFQAVVYGVVNGFAEFLPISAKAHRVLLAYLTGWPEPSPLLLGILALGSFLALLVYFIHDWASMISTFIGVIIFRKKPMTLDERLPLFMAIATIPPVVAWYYLRDILPPYATDPLFVAGGLVAFSLPLWFCDHFSRRNKGMFDWNATDSLLVGLFQALLWLPGSGRSTLALSGAVSRNYNREAAAKFMFFCAGPLLAAAAFNHLHSGDGAAFAERMREADLSWFTLIVAFLAALFSGLLAIGGLMKHVQRKGFAGYIAYRCLLAIVVFGVFYMRNRSAS